MIFVDTSGWFAVSIAEDVNHAAAARWVAQNAEPLITSDYVVDETLTLLRTRDQGPTALALGRAFFNSTVAAVHHLTPGELHEAWRVFEKFSDKEWSFTDCTSKVLMEKLRIERAFAFDHHFQQFGNVRVTPAIS